MSSKQLDNIIASTMPIYLRDLCDNWFRGNPALEAVMSKPGVQRSHDSGTHIQIPLIVAGNDNIGSYSAYDPLKTTPTKEFGYGQYPWRQFYAGLSTCGFEVCVNQGSKATFNLVDMKLKVLKMSLQDKLSEWFLTSTGRGNNKKDPYGLPRILGGITQPDDQGRVAPIMPELGGLDASDPACSWWSAYIDDGGRQAALNAGEPAPAPRPLTVNLLYKTYLCIGKNGRANKPDCILMSKELWIDLASQLQTQVLQSSTRDFELGAESINWMGVRIVWDDQIPPDTVLFLNSDYLNWDYLSDCYMKMRPWITPLNQDASYTQILSIANLTTCSRMMHGMLCNVRPLCK